MESYRLEDTCHEVKPLWPSNRWACLRADHVRGQAGGRLLGKLPHRRPLRPPRVLSPLLLRSPKTRHGGLPTGSHGSVGTRVRALLPRLLSPQSPAHSGMGTEKGFPQTVSRCGPRPEDCQGLIGPALYSAVAFHLVLIFWALDHKQNEDFLKLFVSEATSCKAALEMSLVGAVAGMSSLGADIPSIRLVPTTVESQPQPCSTLCGVTADVMGFP